MKTALVFAICLSVPLFAMRTGSPGGFNEPSSYRGTYTVAASYAVGLSSSYGLAIKSSTPNSIWISNYSSLQNIEFSMATGTATGTTFSISGGVDPDDQGFCEYSGSPDQFFFGNWTSSYVAVFDASTTGPGAYFKTNIIGPAGWNTICGVDAGHDNMYVSCFFANQIAWGAYTGTQSSVTWTTAPFESVSGMAVWEDYLFVCCQITGSDNIFIFQLNADGSPNMTPVWSCNFTHSTSSAGGIDYDGEYLWLYPQNDSLFKLELDWTPAALERQTWGAIKSFY